LARAYHQERYFLSARVLRVEMNFDREPYRLTQSHSCKKGAYRMLNQLLPTARPGSQLYPVLTLAAAAAIFIVDTFTPLNIAIAVLYVAVIMISANFLSRDGLIAIAALCVFLTIISFAIVHGTDFESGALVRCLVSLSAISVTTLLALKNHQATHDIKDQAALLDLTHDAIYVRDANDIITYWNVGAEELYGWQRDEAIGHNAAQLLNAKFPLPLDVIAKELNAKGRWRGEITHTKRDGTDVTVASRWSQQHDEKGRAFGTMVTNSDITEQKRAEDALHKAQAELAHVTRVMTLGELTASIAHEVNQPLAAVVTNGEAALRWLQRDVPNLSEVQSSLERIIGNGRRASDVVARLRALARKSDLMHAELDVNELVDDVLLLVERELIARNISLKLDLAPGDLQVLGDRVQLQQAIINLVVNAVQAMSSMTDRSRSLQIRTRNLLDEAGEKSIVVEVSDTGPGIDPSIANKLFSAFYTTKADGMGMGLSICRSIIESHGGKISVSSELGQGATFVVRLPIKEKEETA
jgi:two-component system, LuxR family, sensor kinase FixL